MFLYGSLEYFIENGEEDTEFYSIPQGMWYAEKTLPGLRGLQPSPGQKALTNSSRTVFILQ